MRQLAVIGGGLAGLTVSLRRANAGDRVTLFEALPELGGQLKSERAGPLLIEHGAEGFVAGSEPVRKLARDAGIESSLVGQLVTKSYGFDGQELRALAPGEAATLLGFQVPRGELGKGIGSFRGGMGELILALTAATDERVEVHTGAPAVLEKTPHGWRVCAPGRDPVEASSVVVATRARTAAALLEPHFGEPAAALANAPVVSSVTVSLAFPRQAVDHPLDGTGFVVAERAQAEGFRACTFVSSKLPERAPENVALFRLFFRPQADDIATLSDDAWTERAERSLVRAVRVRGKFERAWVSRWPDALPVFDDEHRARVAALEAALEKSGVVLAGSAFHGAGIDAAVRSAERVSAGLG